MGARASAILGATVPRVLQQYCGCACTGTAVQWNSLPKEQLYHLYNILWNPQADSAIRDIQVCAQPCAKPFMLMHPASISMNKRLFRQSRDLSGSTFQCLPLRADGAGARSRRTTWTW
eukprot:3276265-Rhodomonas_salina.4